MRLKYTVFVAFPDVGANNHSPLRTYTKRGEPLRIRLLYYRGRDKSRPYMRHVHGRDKGTCPLALLLNHLSHRIAHADDVHACGIAAQVDAQAAGG